MSYSAADLARQRSEGAGLRERVFAHRARDTLSSLARAPVLDTPSARGHLIVDPSPPVESQGVDEPPGRPIREA